MSTANDNPPADKTLPAKDTPTAKKDESNGTVRLPPYSSLLDVADPAPKDQNTNPNPFPNSSTDPSTDSTNSGTQATEAKSPIQDRRLSREWDASKVPPSQFQRPKGSIFATPKTRDDHVGRADGDQRYWDKMREKVGRGGGLKPVVVYANVCIGMAS